MLDKLDSNILKLLYESQEPMASSQVAAWINRSSRMVRNRIKVINESLLTNGAKVDMLQGVGLELVILNPHKFKGFWQRITAEGDEVADSDLKKCIHLFIKQEDYLRVNELCERLYLSKSKLTTVLNELRRILKRYTLRLQTKSHYGMKIEGSELNFRRFIASYYVQESVLEVAVPSSISHSIPKTRDVCQEILGLIQEQIVYVNYPMPMAIQKNLVKHLMIMLHRANEGKSIGLMGLSEDYTINEQEYHLARSIVHEIQRRYTVPISEREILYIAMHLIGKKVLNFNDNKTIPPEINQLVANILVKIYKDKKINLLNDFDLRMMLALHLVPLVSRIMCGMELKNPIIEEVKVKSVAGYDLAIICGQLINETYQTVISDHELSYFAIHFDVALHKEQERIDKKDVLIICASGRASAQLLKIKFEQLFSKFLNHISVCDVSELPLNLQVGFDYIFTTIPLPEEIQLNAPVFEFSFFLDDLSIQKIESVLNKPTDDFLPFLSRDLFLDMWIW